MSHIDSDSAAVKGGVIPADPNSPAVPFTALMEGDHE
jgi:hypothetical protein